MLHYTAFSTGKPTCCSSRSIGRRNKYVCRHIACGQNMYVTRHTAHEELNMYVTRHTAHENLISILFAMYLAKRAEYACTSAKSTRRAGYSAPDHCQRTVFNSDVQYSALITHGKILRWSQNPRWMKCIYHDTETKRFTIEYYASRVS